MPPIKKHHGGALLTALFIMSLVAIVATAMSSKVQVDIYRTRLIITHDKLYLASQAVEFWAMTELNNPKKLFNKANAQGRVNIFPRNMATIYPTVTLTGDLYDLQSRYNLNNLVDKRYLLGFVNMLGKGALQLPPAEKINLALAINDWVSSYDLGIGKDIYLSYYLKQKPPYNPSRQLMSSSSELRLVKDVSAQTYLSLAPYITALPESTPININTSPKQILLSLSNVLNEDKADELIAAREENGVRNQEKVNALLQKLNISNLQITRESTYFLAVAHAVSDNMNLTAYTLLKRNRDKKGKTSVSIIRQSFNIF